MSAPQQTEADAIEEKAKHFTQALSQHPCLHNKQTTTEPHRPLSVAECPDCLVRAMTASGHIQHTMLQRAAQLLFMMLQSWPDCCDRCDELCEYEMDVFVDGEKSVASFCEKHALEMIGPTKKDKYRSESSVLLGHVRDLLRSLGVQL